MPDPTLLHELLQRAADRHAHRAALSQGGRSWDYAALAGAVEAFARAAGAVLPRGARVAVWLDKGLEAVVAMFGSASAGLVFVPVNPLLRPAQVTHVLHDCGAALLVTSAARLRGLAAQWSGPALQGVVLVGAAAEPVPGAAAAVAASVTAWDTWLKPGPSGLRHRVIDADLCAILYTSGSTGRPKGVMLSHRNLVCGAGSVSAYLGQHSQDVLLAVLPLSFDAGFSQLTTAFAVGARAVLLNYLVPADVITALERERVTGLTAVPALYAQLVSQPWPPGCGSSLRYFANTGGRMPRALLDTLRERLPGAAPFLMYGLTEAFRSTVLEPAEVARRPESIGRAIPNAEVMVLREDGTECAPHEAGELVHRGPLVAQGYWGDAALTAERFKPLPLRLRPAGSVLPEFAVYSGDTVTRDEEGFLYFVGRRDEMIKTSGYRVSPDEVEEVLYACAPVLECAVYGLPHATLGQAVHASLVLAPDAAPQALESVLEHCRQMLPAWMVPAGLLKHDGSLPRNPNGKIDRRLLAAQAQARLPP
jgi:acyl-CoA ligase (AMP-forming) (exosortase A-associated)